MKHLVLLGAGHAHVHLLSTLAARPVAGVQISLVTPYPRQFYAGMVPTYVAGHCALEDCAIALAPVLESTGVTWHRGNVTGLNVAERSLSLDDGSTLTYDLLSINAETVQDRQKIEHFIPGSREHALFVRPIEPFGMLWPKVLELGQQRPLRFAIVGGASTGFELACAVAHRLAGSSVTLLSGDAPVGSNCPVGVQAMLARALKERFITVIQERVIGIAAGEVSLSSGAKLACDVPVITIGMQTPNWLQGSGLALDENRLVAVDKFGRSTSHPQVFAVADMASCIDSHRINAKANPACASSTLVKNIRAVLAGIEPPAVVPKIQAPTWWCCGDRRAVVQWGVWSAQGRWAWWLKNWLDRRLMRRYAAGRGG